MKRITMMLCVAAAVAPVSSSSFDTYASEYRLDNAVMLFGGLKNLTDSDDRYTVIGPASHSGKPVSIEFTGYLEAGSPPNELIVQLESSVQGGMALQTIEMYSYKLDRWVLLDKNTLTFKDQLREVLVDGNYFVGPKGTINMRVSWFFGALAPKSFRLDLVRWVAN